jgi:hypothetical protein
VHCDEDVASQSTHMYTAVDWAWMTHRSLREVPLSYFMSLRLLVLDKGKVNRSKPKALGEL